MRYTREKQLEHTARIRRILVMSSNASVREIREMLEKDRKRPLKLDKDYIRKLVRRIRKERTKRINDYTLNQKLAEFEDKLNESDLRLWSIVNDSMSSFKNKVSALREIRNNNKELFDKMFDAGVFEKKLGEVTVKDEKSIKEIEKMPIKKRRKFYAKLAEAQKILGNSKPD